MDDTPELSRATPRRCGRSCASDDIPGASFPRWNRLAETDRDRRQRAASRSSDELVRRVTFELYRTISAFPTPRARICASGRRGCSNFSSPTRQTIRRCGRKSTDRAARCAPMSTSVIARAAQSAQRNGRCARPLPCRAAAGEPGFSDDRSAPRCMGFIVGGPPQPPMVRAAGARAIAAPSRRAGRRATGRRATTTIRCLPAMSSRRCASIRSRRSCRALRATNAMIAAGTPRADRRPEGQNGLRRLQLGHDGRAGGWPIPQIQSAPADRTNISISATACTNASAST